MAHLHFRFPTLSVKCPAPCRGQHTNSLPSAKWHYDVIYAFVLCSMFSHFFALYLPQESMKRLRTSNLESRISLAVNSLLWHGALWRNHLVPGYDERLHDRCNTAKEGLGVHLLSI